MNARITRTLQSIGAAASIVTLLACESTSGLDDGPRGDASVPQDGAPNGVGDAGGDAIGQRDTSPPIDGAITDASSDAGDAGKDSGMDASHPVTCTVQTPVVVEDTSTTTPANFRGLSVQAGGTSYARIFVETDPEQTTATPQNEVYTVNLSSAPPAAVVPAFQLAATAVPVDVHRYLDAAVGVFVVDSVSEAAQLYVIPDTYAGTGTAPVATALGTFAAGVTGVSGDFFVNGTALASATYGFVATISKQSNLDWALGTDGEITTAVPSPAITSRLSNGGIFVGQEADVFGFYSPTSYSTTTSIIALHDFSAEFAAPSPAVASSGTDALLYFGGDTSKASGAFDVILLDSPSSSSGQFSIDVGSFTEAQLNVASQSPTSFATNLKTAFTFPANIDVPISPASWRAFGDTDQFAVIGRPGSLTADGGVFNGANFVFMDVNGTAIASYVGDSAILQNRPGVINAIDIAQQKVVTAGVTTFNLAWAETTFQGTTSYDILYFTTVTCQ